MRRIDFQHPEALHGVWATRAIEQASAAQLPPHTLMARAGHSVARLTRALAPHAQTIWVACGPGNNGGDGLMAATHLHLAIENAGLSRSVWVTLAGDPNQLPMDAAHALRQALAAGIRLSSAPPANFDIAIDALLGLGASRPPQGELAAHLTLLDQSPAPVLCVDMPSGLKADSGELMQTSRTPTSCGPRHTLALLTLKPGLFTAHGRDAAGDIWLDQLGAPPNATTPPDAMLCGWTQTSFRPPARHASHKGSHGEVLVIGGQSLEPSGIGMTGAAVLAARAALRSGAGRVYLCRLANATSALDWDPGQPELMPRSPQAALDGDLLERAAVVCGCGGGDAIAPLLATVLSRATTLVLDADALNGLASDPVLQNALRKRQTQRKTTVITPHPLEAARLLGTTTQHVMADRLAAARALSEQFGVICVLKGSGTVIHAPGEIPHINGSGNSALATAGTGDVLAGMLGAALASQNHTASPFLRTAQAVFEHGRLADAWVAQHGDQRSLCADQLTQQG